MALSEPYQRGIRLAIAVLLACLIGYGLILPDHGLHVSHKKEFSNGLKWSAITCIVVSAPVIGRAAQTGAERILGTVTGGFLGFGLFSIGSNYWDTVSDGVVLSIGAAIVAFTSVTIGAAYGLENSTKLYALTYMLVTFGSENLATKQGALALTLTRICGICFGVFLSELTSVLIFPKSATLEAIQLLRKSLENLADLNAIAWQHGPLFRPDWKSMLPGEGQTAMEDWWHSKQKLLQTKDWEVDPSKREAAFEAECEKVFMQTYSFLNKVQDHLAPARSEVYVGHLGRRMTFLPGIPWLQIGHRVLPEPEIQTLATCIRRVARLLWSVHLSFQEGFDKNMLAMLKQQYPADIMPDLAQQTQGCLQDMADAFPDGRQVPDGHMRSLSASVESLLRISDYQRRRVLHHVRGRCPSQQSEKTESEPRPASVARNMSRKLSGQLPRDYAFGRSKSRRLESPAHWPNGGAIDSAAERQADSRQWQGQAGAHPSQSSDTDLEVPLLASLTQHNSGEVRSPRRHGSKAQASLNGEVNREGIARNTAIGTLTSTEQCGSPSEVFRDLPPGLEIVVDTNGSRTSTSDEATADPEIEESEGHIKIRLHKVASTELLVFPESAEGFVDKEELTEELEEMHEVIETLLQKLPQPCLV